LIILVSADKLQKLPLQVNPEESASNGDMENPLSNANIDKTKDLGSTSSVGTFSLQSGRGHERADSSESIYSNSGLENSLPRDDSDEDFGEASLSGQEDTDGSEAVLAWAEVREHDIILSLTHLYVGGQMLVKSTSKTVN
jgi:hypothetical protein